jgi:hypothetical protein
MNERELYIKCQQLIRGIDLSAASDEIFMQVVNAGTLKAFHINPPENWLPQAIVAAALMTVAGNLQVPTMIPVAQPAPLEVVL